MTACLRRLRRHPAPMDVDAVSAVLYGYLALSRDDRRRFRLMLQRADRKASAGGIQ